MNHEAFLSLMHDSELWELFTHQDTNADSGYDSLRNADPTVPQVSEYLIKHGYRAEYPNHRKFAICLTHDVDDIYPPLTHRILSGLWSLWHRDLHTAKAYLLWSRRRRRSSPYLNFKEIMELEQKYDAKSTFYVITAERDPRRFRYNIEDIPGELREIADSGWEVGLHGGYDSYHDPDAIKREKDRLEKALGREVIGYRNHYLKFHTPDTWEILAQCGFKYDTTYGYTNTVGFRNGMCHPFQPFNGETGQWIDLFEIPLHVMESAMLNTSLDEAWERIRELLEKAESNHGVLTVLWHNNTFSSPYREQWRILYEKILQYGRDRNAWMTSGEEIWKWWRNNGYSNHYGCGIVGSLCGRKPSQPDLS